ncbi:uncharacterized protein PAC_05240 [Phialocephala subalpina]|uniref:Uncharacterized protein n=1 Tax=Phialocephala subalpina TaxID=576137 RepID=A0A1L7WRG1_9HELO|nr:uncharacterized protein PAC_05240 [Phialocephala subalpina]
MGAYGRRSARQTEQFNLLKGGNIVPNLEQEDKHASRRDSTTQNTNTKPTNRPGALNTAMADSTTNTGLRKRQATDKLEQTTGKCQRTDELIVPTSDKPSSEGTSPNLLQRQPTSAMSATNKDISPITVQQNASNAAKPVTPRAIAKMKMSVSAVLYLDIRNTNVKSFARHACRLLKENHTLHYCRKRCCVCGLRIGYPTHGLNCPF